MSSTTSVDEDYDALDEDEGGLSGFWILIIFIAVLAAFAGIVKMAYEKGTQTAAANEAALPTVSADPTPVRQELGLEPADPGRQEVFDELNNVSPTRVAAEITPDRDPLAGFNEDASVRVDVPTVQEARVAAATETPDPAPVVSRPVVPAPAPEPAPVAAQPQPAPRPAPQPSRNVAPAATSTGPFAVQVGAFGSNGEAMGYYSTMSQKHGAFVSSQSPEVNVATVKGTTYHRLWLGGFASRAAAGNYCDGLKSRGQSCYVQKR